MHIVQLRTSYFCNENKNSTNNWSQNHMPASRQNNLWGRLLNGIAYGCHIVKNSTNSHQSEYRIRLGSTYTSFSEAIRKLSIELLKISIEIQQFNLKVVEVLLKFENLHLKFQIQLKFKIRVYIHNFRFENLTFSIW